MFVGKLINYDNFFFDLKRDILCVYFLQDFILNNHFLVISLRKDVIILNKLNYHRSCKRVIFLKKRLRNRYYFRFLTEFYVLSYIKLFIFRRLHLKFLFFWDYLFLNRWFSFNYYLSQFFSRYHYNKNLFYYFNSLIVRDFIIMYVFRQSDMYFSLIPLSVDNYFAVYLANFFFLIFYYYKI